MFRGELRDKDTPLAIFNIWVITKIRRRDEIIHGAGIERDARGDEIETPRKTQHLGMGSAAFLKP